MEYIVENFNSINELRKAINGRALNSVFAACGDLSSETGSYDFTKTHSYSEAVGLLRNGYAEPLEKIKRGVEVNFKGTATQKTAVKTDVVGFAPCVPNAIRGIPQSMINKDVAVKKSKIVTIIHDVTGACHVKADDFIKAGIATLSIVNSLEARGYRVALKMDFINCSEMKQKLFATVTVKEWRQPLDIKKLTFPICHPSMLRRIGFKYLETQPKMTDTAFRWGYGKADGSANSYQEMVKILRDNHLIADHEKYINIKLCQEYDYDPQKIAKACGLE